MSELFTWFDVLQTNADKDYCGHFRNIVEDLNKVEISLREVKLGGNTHTSFMLIYIGEIRIQPSLGYRHLTDTDEYLLSLQLLHKQVQ